MCYSGLRAGVGLVSPADSAAGRLLGFPQKSAKPLPCGTYGKPAHISLVCRTYQGKGLKVLYLPYLGKNPPRTLQSVNQELA